MVMGSGYRPRAMANSLPRDDLRGLDLLTAPADGGDARRVAGDVLDRRRRSLPCRGRGRDAELEPGRRGRDCLDCRRPPRSDRVRDLARDPAHCVQLWDGWVIAAIILW